jgi:hypothetical protein
LPDVTSLILLKHQRCPAAIPTVKNWSVEFPSPYSGMIINRQLPAAALWVIGMFIGIEMLFNGWAWVMLALGLRAVHKAT